MQRMITLAACSRVMGSAGIRYCAPAFAWPLMTPCSMAQNMEALA